MAIVWVCMECGKEQPDQELQCACGNIDALMFVEKGLHTSEDFPVQTMVEETPVDVAPMADDTPVKTPGLDPEPKKKSKRGKMRPRTSR